MKLNEKYQEWYQSNPPKIPKKYLAKPIHGELQHNTEIRNHLATETMRYEIEIMKTNGLKL